MSRADLIRRFARHQCKAFFLELKLGVLDEQPRHVLGLSADFRDGRPAHLTHDRAHATRVPLVD